MAAVFVLLYHWHIVFGGLQLFRHAELAVDFFFLLSGYVLSCGVERNCSDTGDGLIFLAQRIARLWPIMAIGTGLGFVVACYRDGPTPDVLTSLAMGLLFVPGMRARELIFPLNGPQWSLLIELIANAAHGLLLWRLRTRMLCLIAIVFWLCLAWVAHMKGEIGLGPTYPGWQIGLLRVGFAYTLGTVLARHSAGLVKRLRAPWWLPALVLGLLLTRPGRSDGLDGWGDLLTLLAFAPVLAFSLAAHPPAALRQALRAAGAASWPLYAFHIPLFDAAKLIAAKGVMPQNVAASIAVMLAIGLAMAVGSSRIVKGIALPSRSQAPARAVHAPA